MADLFFLLAGIVLLFKGKVQISHTRSLSGRVVKYLGILYVLPFTIGFISSFVAKAIGGFNPTLLSWIEIPFIILALLVTLYLVIFHDSK